MKFTIYCHKCYSVITVDVNNETYLYFCPECGHSGYVTDGRKVRE